MIDPYALVRQAGALLLALHDRDSPRIWRSLTDAPAPPRTDPACLWARARRRYLHRIAALPVPHPRPAWWTATDEAARGEQIEDGGWRCRTCALWRSQDGLSGFCGMDETPATVNCGATGAGDLCEQWTAWPRVRKHDD